MTRLLIVTSFFSLLLSLNSCVVNDPYLKLPPGEWRLSLQTERNEKPLNKKARPEYADNVKFEERQEGEIPTNFTVNYIDEDNFNLAIYNGDTTIVTDIIYNRDIKTAYDTIEIKFGNNKLKGIYQEGIIEGDWYAENEVEPIHFLAKHGKIHRFTELKKESLYNITGDWSFNIDKNKQVDTINLQLNHKGNHLSCKATVGGKTTTLIGTVQKNKFYLSRFDGYNALLIEGKIEDDNNIVGVLQFNKNSKHIWKSVKK